MSPIQATLQSIDRSAEPLSFEDYLTYNDASGRRYELLDTGALSNLYPGDCCGSIHPLCK